MSECKISADEIIGMGKTIESLMEKIRILEEENKIIQAEWTMCDRACKMWNKRSEKLKKVLYKITVQTKDDDIFKLANDAVENYYD
ncbi:hypothetical protein G7L40_20415 [Paenibacillus polymyxa]|uniref:Uncharacterized protein n=1 Tax=Paenibacillus polymyxa TaxID=1406 RepID=A0A378Y121_PAEPO|nr:hypothetical protein [Paenibacillus polymyxa]MBE7896146.1 hypothetical protein [Paenibacillus polymyxa]MBG9765910.1 hypothetical protein [Paenibacillus polymyxa]MCC3256676.1 hypothetical protein [Paenibacillus polymyxa]QPK54833.1 hypothetical protein G7035_20460 [Paenibacillus polymyxa]QPK59924.1 hypothetical protein G7L40_20415 [Paenibacillus polymyxa]